MFVIPDEFEWLYPWAPIEDPADSLEWGQFQADLQGGGNVAATIEDELRREMPDGHPLKNLKVHVVAVCLEDASEFVFVTILELAPSRWST